MLRVRLLPFNILNTTAPRYYFVDLKDSNEDCATLFSVGAFQVSYIILPCSLILAEPGCCSTPPRSRMYYVSNNKFPHFLFTCIFFLHHIMHLYVSFRCKEKDTSVKRYFRCGSSEACLDKNFIILFTSYLYTGEVEFPPRMQIFSCYIAKIITEELFLAD